MSIKDLADRLGPLDEMRNTPSARSFTLGVWRALRDHGAPLDQAALDQIAAGVDLGLIGTASLVARYAELNDDGALVGLSGLSIADHPHSIQFPTRTLSSWCVWDPFFLVPALGGSAIVRSTDPETGTSVQFTFEDGHVIECAPSDTLISIVVPQRPPDRPDDEPQAGSTVEELWASFCNQVLPFESRASGERYFATGNDDVELVTIEQASELAYLRHGALIELASLG